jgi:hypothetical protein
VADVQWTFPLEFVEVVWGDGQRTDRQVISATGLPAFGSHRFQIPFSADGKKWVRFAAWDSAYEGAILEPQRLEQHPDAAPIRHVADRPREQGDRDEPERLHRLECYGR